MILINFFKKSLVSPLLNLLKQGITPEKLALSVGLGVSFGIFPVIGSTTILCTAFGFIFRVNQAAIQLVNYFSYPLQLAFFIPFFQLGAFIFQTDPLPFSIEDIFVMLAADTVGAIKALWIANLRAIVAWMLIGPVLCFVIYRILTPVFTRLAPRPTA
ncbi:DUF2062 domain-containing protein [bacterium]|nr:DUF2062 domain-containing protein [bacterium]